jgi:hypothetical protein
MKMEIYEQVTVPSAPGRTEAAVSGVSWGAVIGGAFVTAALSLILLALGAGFGLSTVSPWSAVGASAATVGALAIFWLLLTQIVASAMGGYLTGRLRTKWTAIHGDEVHFRDTANGFLAWAVALVLTAGFLATEAAHMAGSPAARTTAAVVDVNGYFVDRLFRSSRSTTPEADAAIRAETSRILTRAIRPDAPPEDAAYLAELVTAKTGLSPDEARQRVNSVLASLKLSEDETRQATAHLLLWLFLALLTGAFCASYSATIGGRQRDHVLVA